ncbi:MAG: UDP-N-acetylglucosamine--N-acetylmuramyl-(pentapeptide) pyrophosphoryl-undecaprenol N-acetylglucosamine transferase, partial [Planctomycetes bacterium]|nr:UDP-N-acetylglucosamine--N-acetylmuramyl-(pentapeptide) pyrophosphoryl-undecaprenol N-acetylglucosamine transferase [Planctomycetota bacterium]
VGRVNRWLLHPCSRIFLAYPDTRGPRLLRRRSLIYGCPVRSEFSFTPLPSEGSVLVLGGSQGSDDLNELAVGAAERLPAELRSSARFHHVAGPGKRSALVERYRRAGIRAEVVEYEPRVAECLKASRLVIARAGGSTTAEISAVGRGALFLPYPHHRDRQQYLNAQVSVAAGAAVVVPNEPATVTGVLAEILGDRARLETMADASVRLGRPSAAVDIARVIATHVGALPVREPRERVA